jgi:hypothetical protein
MGGWTGQIISGRAPRVGHSHDGDDAGPGEGAGVVELGEGLWCNRRDKP